MDLPRLCPVRLRCKSLWSHPSERPEQCNAASLSGFRSMRTAQVLNNRASLRLPISVAMSLPNVRLATSTSAIAAVSVPAADNQQEFQCVRRSAKQLGFSSLRACWLLRLSWHKAITPGRRLVPSVRPRRLVSRRRQSRQIREFCPVRLSFRIRNRASTRAKWQSAITRRNMPPFRLRHDRCHLRPLHPHQDACLISDLQQHLATLPGPCN